MDLSSFVAGVLLKKLAWILDKALGGVVSEYAKKIAGPYLGLKPTIGHLNALVGQAIEKADRAEQQLQELIPLAEKLWKHNEQLQAEKITLQISLGNALSENASLRQRLRERSELSDHISAPYRSEDHHGDDPSKAV